MKRLPSFLKNKEARIARMCERYGVTLFYLFGSAAKRKSTPISDIDFAYLPLRTLSLEEDLNFRGDLEDLCGSDEIDLVDLSSAHPLLAHRVISAGAPLFVGRDTARRDFEERAMLEYLDTIPLRNIQAGYLRVRIRDDSFGRLQS